MIRSRWWLVALGATGLGVLAVLLANGVGPAALTVGASAVVVYSALFL
ncbi:ATP-binding protein, partial [Schumannella luteola]